MNEKIFFKNNEGNVLCGVLAKPRDATVCVVIAHGFTSNKDRPRYKKISALLEEENIASFRFDFTGSGESKHIPLHFKTHVTDLTFAIKEMKKRYKTVFLIAESMAAHYAMRTKDLTVDELVFWAPKTNRAYPNSVNDTASKQELAKTGQKIIGKDSNQFIVPKQYLDSLLTPTPKELASTIKMPILIIQGTADYMIEDTEKMIPLFPKGTVLELVEGATHNYASTPEFEEIFLTKTLEWILDKVKKYPANTPSEDEA